MNLFHKCSIRQLYKPLYFINITLQYNCSMHSVNLIKTFVVGLYCVNHNHEITTYKLYKLLHSQEFKVSLSELDHRKWVSVTRGVFLVLQKQHKNVKSKFLTLTIYWSADLLTVFTLECCVRVFFHPIVCM